MIIEEIVSPSSPTLADFYNGLYAESFPDSNERESLENMQNYLSLKNRGWYGKNNYHILVGRNDAGKIISGAVIDYLANPNAGVLEFVTVEKTARQKGVGKNMLARIEELLSSDAAGNGMNGVDFIIAEVENPAKLSPGETHQFDPVLRLGIWRKLGFKAFDFPYVQPALSENQKPVDYLFLAVKTLKKEWETLMPQKIVAEAVHEYIRWAMRIDNPLENAEFIQMKKSLSAEETINLVDFTAPPA